MKESRVPEVCLLQCQNQGGQFEQFLSLSGGHDLDTMLQKAFVHKTFVSRAVM
jgi:hypothetical protein